MSRQLSIAEAKSRLTAAVHDVERGEPIELTRRGKPVAMLVSMADYRRFRAREPDFWAALQSFRADADLVALDASGAFEGLADPQAGRDFRW